MRYLSVCSGIEAATVAWHPLGWQPAAFSEIAPFPRAVLAHHYPHVPLHSDFTTIKGDEYGPVDLLVGGTPCQSFSVAGLRGGLHDERGNLALEYLRLADRTRPRWLVWENVPGVYSATSDDAPDHSDDGDGRWEDDANEAHAFACFLAGLRELGYHGCYRTLDAQYFGIPQRRRRVFVVGHLGDWRRAAAVLFERHSLSWHPAPRREQGQAVAGTLKACAGKSGTPNGAEEADRLICTSEADDPLLPICFGGQMSTPQVDEDLAQTMGAKNPLAVAFTQNQRDEVREVPVAGALSAESGSHQQTYVAFTDMHNGQVTGDVAATMGTRGSSVNSPGPTVMAFTQNQREEIRMMDVAGALNAAPDVKRGSGTLMQGSAVRRLTPRECERLQGFPDDFTLVPYRGKLAVDGPRYKALGNAMAVPVMSWIGQRIQMVEALQFRSEAA